MGDLVNDFDFTRAPQTSGAVASAVGGLALPSTRDAGPAAVVAAASTLFAVVAAGAVRRRRRPSAATRASSRQSRQS
jgi:hypothetical protein